MNDFPEIATAVALEGAGPYRLGDLLYLAFTDVRAARVLAHEPRATPDAETSRIPETLPARVLRGAGPYRDGQIIALSFVDPSYARIATLENAAHEIAPVSVPPAQAVPAHAVTSAATVPAGSDIAEVAVPARPQPVAMPDRIGTCVSLDWSHERASRFVAVVDKLFTSERLGWYRHVFAMRLLLPDRVTTGDPGADEAAATKLAALRRATVASLGRPLLAAFMPNFTITTAWLESLEAPEVVSSTEELRAMVAGATATLPSGISPGDRCSVGWLAPGALRAGPRENVNATLPYLIAPLAASTSFSERAFEYRESLIEAFGQLRDAPETVRLRGMAQANRALDDRLWNFASAVSETMLAGTAQ